MTTDSDKVTHLQMIQGIINRLAGNSFDIKRWSVLLSAAMAATIPEFRSASLLPIFLIGPIIVFWGLDAYYLWQERLFRNLYKRVRRGEIEKFSMILDKSKEGRGKATWVNCVISRTTSSLYIILAALIFFVYCATGPNIPKHCS